MQTINFDCSDPLTPRGENANLFEFCAIRGEYILFEAVLQFNNSFPNIQNISNMAHSNSDSCSPAFTAVKYTNAN